MIAVKGLALIGLILLAVFPLLFVGGLLSALWEAHRERKAGLPVSRPAWENRAKRQALGGVLGQLQALWANLQTPIRMCWCGRGPIQHFEALSSFETEGFGCAAWEAGDERAIVLHDRAGGYARTPDSSSTWVTGRVG